MKLIHATTQMKLENNYVERPVTKKQYMYDSTYINVLNRQIYRNRK